MSCNDVENNCAWTSGKQEKCPQQLTISRVFHDTQVQTWRRATEPLEGVNWKELHKPHGGSWPDSEVVPSQNSKYGFRREHLMTSTGCGGRWKLCFHWPDVSALAFVLPTCSLYLRSLTPSATLLGKELRLSGQSDPSSGTDGNF